MKKPFHPIVIFLISWLLVSSCAYKPIMTPYADNLAPRSTIKVRMKQDSLIRYIKVTELDSATIIGYQKLKRSDGSFIDLGKSTFLVADMVEVQGRRKEKSKKTRSLQLLPTIGYNVSGINTTTPQPHTPCCNSTSIESVDYNSIGGVNLGLTFNKQLSASALNGIFIRMGIAYSERGYNYHFTGAYTWSNTYNPPFAFGSSHGNYVPLPPVTTTGSSKTDDHATIRLKYIEVPFLIDFHFGRKANFLISAGGYFGYPITSNVTISTLAYPITYTTKSINNLGLQLGAGFVAHKHLRFDMGYSWGLTSFSYDDLPGLQWGQSATIRTFTLSIGVPIDLGKPK